MIYLHPIKFWNCNCCAHVKFEAILREKKGILSINTSRLKSWNPCALMWHMQFWLSTAHHLLFLLLVFNTLHLLLCCKITYRYPQICFIRKCLQQEQNLASIFCKLVGSNNYFILIENNYNPLWYPNLNS